jgi:pyridoxamine 5'-phosphate oxidase family protein
MLFTAAELDYLTTQPLGRLATAQPDGTLQVSPVGFTWNDDLGTIDIGGWNMAASRKYRNVADNGRVAFVVDDLPSVDPWRVRCLEIRGVAEAVPPGAGSALIRIHPRRIISFGVDAPDSEAHALVPSKRNVAD